MILTFVFAISQEHVTNSLSTLKQLAQKLFLCWEYWEKKLVKGYLVEETRRMVLPNWKIEEWNIFEKIINNEETSTCKLEAWHQTSHEGSSKL